MLIIIVPISLKKIVFYFRICKLQFHLVLTQHLNILGWLLGDMLLYIYSLSPSLTHRK